MPVCVGVRAAGGGLPGRGGAGTSGHTTGWCLAHLLHARLDGFGRLRLLLTWPVLHYGTSRQAQRRVSDSSLLKAIAAQSPMMGYAGPYLEPHGVRLAECVGGQEGVG